MLEGTAMVVMEAELEDIMAEVDMVDTEGTVEAEGGSVVGMVVVGEFLPLLEMKRDG
jgi:hypothetical protein